MRFKFLYVYFTLNAETYPAICPDSPSYNPNISADDCADLSCCEFSGDLAAVGHKPIDYVRNTNMVAFYDSSDPDGLYWADAYANKTIEVSKTFNGRKYIFNATILDNCVNADCDDCCIRDSASTGYMLVSYGIIFKVLWICFFIIVLNYMMNCKYLVKHFNKRSNFFVGDGILYCHAQLRKCRRCGWSNLL